MAQIDHRDPEWVAEKLGLEKNTIYRWLQDGTLPGLQIGRKWLISESELGQFLEQQTRIQTRIRRIQASNKAAGAKVMDLAYEEARRYRHIYVGQEHILLALAQLGESAAAALEACGGTVQISATSSSNSSSPVKSSTLESLNSPLEPRRSSTQQKRQLEKEAIVPRPRIFSRPCSTLAREWVSRFSVGSVLKRSYSNRIWCEPRF